MATFEDPEFKVVVGRSWWGKTCSPTNLTSEYVSGAIATAILTFTYPITPV
jgi:hypothetical protein